MMLHIGIFYVIIFILSVQTSELYKHIKLGFVQNYEFGGSGMHDLIFSVFPSENFVDLGLYQFGREQCEPAHSFGPAARNHYLFRYVISESAVFCAE